MIQKKIKQVKKKHAEYKKQKTSSSKKSKINQYDLIQKKIKQVKKKHAEYKKKKKYYGGDDDDPAQEIQDKNKEWTSSNQPITVKETYTKSEELQRAFPEMEQAQMQEQYYREVIPTINVTKSYVYTKDGKQVTIHGRDLKRKLESEHAEIKKGVIAREQYVHMIRESPPSTTFRHTSKGEIYIQHDKAKEEFRKLQLPEERGGYNWWQKAGKTFFIGVTQAPTFAFGGFLDTKKWAKETAKWESDRWKEAKKVMPGVMTTSAGIMSGKPELIKSGMKKQTPFAVEVGKSPMMIEVYATLATAGLAKGASAGVSKAARATPKLISQTKKFSPTLSKTLTKIGQKESAKKLMSSTVTKNAYKYYAQNYRWAKQPVSETGKTVFRKTFYQGDDIAEVVLRKTTTSDKYRRVLLSPEQLKTAELNLGKKLVTQKGVSPVRGDMSTGKITRNLFKSETKIKGIFNKKLLTTSHSAEITRKVYKPFPNLADDSVRGVGGFEMDVGKKTTTPIFKGTGITKLSYEGRFLDLPDNIMYKITSKKPNVSLSGKWQQQYKIGKNLLFKRQKVDTGLVLSGTRKTKLDFFTGPSLDTPMSAQAKLAKQAAKTWQYKQALKHPFKTFISSKTAAQRITIKPTIQTSKKFSTNLSSKLGLINRSRLPYFPEVNIGRYGMGGLIYTGIKTLKPRIKRESDVYFKTDIHQEPIPVMGISQMQSQGSMFRNIKATIPAMDTKIIQTPVSITATSFDTKTAPTPTPKPMQYSSGKGSFGMPYIPKMGLYGKGAGYKGYSHHKLKYKFRKFDIGDLL